MQAAFKYYSDNIEADLETLDKLDDETNEDTPVLQDHPVDYEVITEGDFMLSQIMKMIFIIRSTLQYR